ncbi:hypothetical protein HYV57_06060 [Candidatus Peregrinibacteria bacterium]|nr:hypothetical protein [Candidatus Peregrinibacteria bacterium]
MSVISVEEFIKQSQALDVAAKEHWLKDVLPRLTDAQKEELRTIFFQEKEALDEVEKVKNQRQVMENTKFLEKLNEFKMKNVSKMIHQAEEKSKIQDEASINTLLHQFDNL